MLASEASHRVRLLGYCELDATGIVERFGREGAGGLADLRGEYTIVLEGADEVIVVTSPFGALHYFYTVRDGRLFHGDRVLDVLGASGLEWEWDREALGDLCQLENLTGNRTLHAAIAKVPAGAVLHFRDGRLDLRAGHWLDSLSPGPPDPDEALEAFNEEVAHWAGDQPTLSLSGGFDSRVILSSLVSQGFRPRVITMGSEDSSDVRVSRQMTRMLDLRHDLIRVRLEDLLEHAAEVSALTNGTKPACHWHTYLYPLIAQVGRDNSFFVGTLGEFARSYYFDRGVLGRLAGLAPGPSLRAFWKAKLGRNWTFRGDEHGGLAPMLAGQLDTGGIAARAEKIAGFCHGSFLDGLARLYLEQRVPNFYANGVKMYLASAGWRSPFHSRRWIRAIRNLGPSWKLGSNWHRFAIGKNHPALLGFQEERGRAEGRMLPRAPFLYWAPFMKSIPYVSYDQSEEWYKSPQIRALVLDQSDVIADLVDRATVESIVAEQVREGGRTRAVSLLLTLILWGANVREATSRGA